MGCIFSSCIVPGQKPDDSRKRLLSNYYPSEDDLPKLLRPTDNDEKFYFLPDKNTIDKTIQELDSIRTFNQNNILKTELTLSQLDAAKININTLRERFSYLTPTDSSNDIGKIITPGNASALQHGGLLILEVQQAMLSRADMVGKANFKKSYVRVEVNKNANIRDSTMSSLQAYVTREITNNLSEPKWCQVFEHPFDVVPDPRLVSINISLVYESDSSDTKTVLGDVQTFRLSSLLDQEVYQRELDLKDKMTKGTIAKLCVRFQLIHQPVLLQTKLLTEINNRHDKLNNILTRSVSPLKMSNADGYKYSMGGISKLKQSNNTQGRPSALKESIYFEEKFFINSDRQSILKST